MTTKTRTVAAPAERAPTAADRLREAEQRVADLDHELHVTIPVREREERDAKGEALKRGDVNGAKAHQEAAFDLARRNNEIIRTALPVAQMELAERRQEAQLAAFGVPDPDDPEVKLADLEAAMVSAEQALLELEAEATSLSTRLREASQAGDGATAAEVWTRQQVLPALIFAARARFLRARLAYVHTRANRPDPQMAALEQAAEKTKAALEQAQIAHNRAQGQLRLAVQEQSDLRSQVRAVERALRNHIGGVDA